MNTPYTVQFGGNGLPTITFCCPICGDHRIRMEDAKISRVAGIHKDSGGLRAELRFGCDCGRKFILSFLTHNDHGVAGWRPVAGGRQDD